MTGSLNFRSNLSSVSAVRPQTSIQRTVQPPIVAPKTDHPKSYSRSDLSPTGGGLHLSAEEMEEDVVEAFEQTSAFDDDLAPLIDLEHLENDSDVEETEEIVEPEPDAEIEEPELLEIEPCEGEDSEESENEDSDRESESHSESPEALLRRYIVSEWERYQMEHEKSELRFALLSQTAGVNSRKSQVALLLEPKLGGLAPVLSGMTGDFIGLSGIYKGLIFDHIGVAQNQSFQLTGFRQALLNHLKMPGIDWVLFDLEFVPIMHRPALISLVNKAGQNKVLIFISANQIQGLK
jgi:hypothetical protein